jgi:preprotein translocase subunit SecE
MAKIDPFKFLQEVRAEAQKVTWPTRKETTVTTMMVFVMVILATIFFLVADQIMRLGIGYLLGINSYAVQEWSSICRHPAPVSGAETV